MHARAAVSSALLALVLASCASPDAPPRMPGAIDAPPPPIAAAGDSLLTGAVWAWQETLMSDGKKIAPAAPERYTIQFAPGGAVAVRADCNRGSGSYVLDGGALAFGPMAVTRAMCPPDSSDAEFLKQLSQVTGQLFRGNDLVLTLRVDAGSMRFATIRQ